MLKNRGTREYLNIKVTINSNRFYPDMDSTSKAQYADFIDEIFNRRLKEFLVYREWAVDRRPYIKRQDDDPAYLPEPDDILYLESSVSHEIGGVYSKLHSEIFIEVCCENKDEHGLDFYHNMVRLLYEQRFGQKCNLRFSRQKSESLARKLYAMKSRDQMKIEAPELASSAQNTVHFFKCNKYKPKSL